MLSVVKRNVLRKSATTLPPLHTAPISKNRRGGWRVGLLALQSAATLSVETKIPALMNTRYKHEWVTLLRTVWASS